MTPRPRARRCDLSWRASGVAALVAVVSLGACAAMPEGRAERALYRDLRVVVETAETTQWVVDRLEIEDAAEPALRSTCQVPVDRQLALLRWLEARIEAAGGPARQQWERHGGEFDGFDDLMTLERVHALLSYAMERDSQDCPFWLERDDDFHGVHQSAGRFVLFGESNGGGSLVIKGDQVGVGGGGAGRLIAAFGVADTFTLGLGAEFGATGAFAQGAGGAQELDARFVLAAPVVLRYQEASTVVDVEVAALSLFTQAGFPDPPGFRVAVGYGFAAPRISDFLPVALLWVGYEYYPTAGPGPDAHAIRLGTRVGVDWDL